MGEVNDRMFRTGTGAVWFCFAAVAAVCADGLASETAWAQSTQLPGLIVTVPPSQAPAPPPSAAEPESNKAPPKTRPQTPPAKREASTGPSSGRGSGQSIAVLVNDDPITGFEIDQRARLLAMQANIGSRAQEAMKRLASSEETSRRWRSIAEQTIRENQGRSREQIMALLEQRRAQFGESLRAQAIESAKASVLPGLRKNALEELVDERLKLQEAKRLAIAVSDADVENIIRNIAKRNNMNDAQFAEHIRKLGSDVNAMRDRFRATLSWNEVVRRRFGRDVVINQLDIDRMITQNTKGDDEVELTVQRIVLSVPGNFNQKAFASRLADAEKIRRNFKNCQGIAGLTTGVDDAKVENLGVRKASSFPEPARTLLLNAREGEMLPPNPGAGGVELYALCGRKVVTADDKARSEAAAELRQQEFELLARRHLRDLRQDAHIEYR